MARQPLLDLSAQAKDKRDYLTKHPEPKLELDVKYAWDLH
jgi:hypothetical protein